MKIQLVSLKDTSFLTQIKQKLKTIPKIANLSQFQQNFKEIISAKNVSQPIFGIGTSENDPKNIQFIYSLHWDYKLTRQLSKCVHIQEIYKSKESDEKKVQSFQKSLIQKLDCYKVVALNIQENNTLKANQVLMSIQEKAQL